MNISKVIHPCDVPMWNGKKYPMFCKIEYKDNRLSITGVIGPTKSGNAMGDCGQIDAEFYHPTVRKDGYYKPSMLRFSKGWDKFTFFKFLRYWHEWHLNDMRSGCEHQRMMGWDKEKIDPSKDAGWHVDSKTANLKSWAYPPVGHLTKACPVCGFKFGTAWVMEDVPEYVLQFLNALPDTDRVPNWI